MSFVDFKEIAINNPGTSTFYGSDDLNEIMRIFNDKVISNRKVRIKNEWEFTDHLDIKAPGAVPANPGANTKRLYVDPADVHLKAKSTGGGIIDFDVLAQGAVGEANTAGNIGTAGVGVFKQKTGINLEFKKINAGSTKVTITDDTANNEVDINLTEVNILLQNLGGILTVAKGGTGVGTFTTNGLLRGAGTGNIVAIAPGTDGHVLTMVTGAPTWAAASAAQDIKTAIFEAGVQVGSVGRRLNFLNADDFTIAEDVANDRFNISNVRSEVCVASWINPGAFTATETTTPNVGTNVGTTYVDVFAANGDGNGTDVDGTGKNDFRFYVSWNKNGGLSAHGCRVVDQAVTTVLAEITNCVNGKNVVTGTIPSFFQDTVKSVKLQMKAGNTTDDPMFRGAHLYFK